MTFVDKILLEGLTGTYKKWSDYWFPGNPLITGEIVLKAMKNAYKVGAFDLEGLNQAPEAINTGFCDFVANEAAEQIPGAIVRTMDYENTQYSDYQSELDDYNFRETNGHSWIEYKGKHYDAEAPNGVKDWRDLPLLKRSKR